jgi:methionyl-tRNA synthetase
MHGPVEGEAAPEKFYITTAIDYVNSPPHLGTAYEKILADVIARYKKLRGYDTRFLMGNDEHSLNVERRAREAGMNPLDYCDKMAIEFEGTWQRLSISYDDFIRTTEARHIASVQKILTDIYDRGDIYKGMYEGWYCVSCETFYDEADLQDGLCPNHRIKAEWIKEENYFFRLTNYRDALLAHIDANPGFILPETRRNEILSLLRGGLKDISISRSSTRWGIPLPFDDKNVVYVWFDALINYLSGIGFANNEKKFRRYWPADLHLIGKDITRFHCIIWPAMLMSAGIELPACIFGHGFISIEGEKMSKTRGTEIDPNEIAQDYGASAVRYYLVREIPCGKDGDFSWTRFIERYNADLANGLGNLVSRVVSMVLKYQDGFVRKPSVPQDQDPLRLMADEVRSAYMRYMDAFELHNGCAEVWKLIRRADTYIEENAPWELAKDPSKEERLQNVLYNLVETLRHISVLAKPIIPPKGFEVWSQIGMAGGFSTVAIKALETWDGIPEGTKVQKGPPLFPRLELKNQVS